MQQPVDGDAPQVGSSSSTAGDGVRVPGGVGASASVMQQAAEARSIFKTLEGRVANPHDIGAVGRAYADVLRWAGAQKLKGLDWTCRYQDNPQLQKVLDLLEVDNAYPSWKRHALDEAYVLLHDDVARQGDRSAVGQLPEPHIPPETGYRVISERLLDRSDARRSIVPGVHEQSAGGCSCGQEVREYEIRLGPPVFYDRARDKRISGREIVAVGATTRQCCLNPIAEYFPISCCSRFGKGMSWFSSADDDAQEAPPPQRASMFPEPGVVVGSPGEAGYPSSGARRPGTR